MIDIFEPDGPTGNGDLLINNQGMLVNVHPRVKCAGVTCWVHSPTEHAMREWPIVVRTDKGIAVFIERTCPHGVSHPDPDQQDYVRSMVIKWFRDEHGFVPNEVHIAEEVEAYFIHGCCGQGCCSVR